MRQPSHTLTRELHALNEICASTTGNSKRFFGKPSKKRMSRLCVPVICIEGMGAFPAYGAESPCETCFLRPLCPGFSGADSRIRTKGIAQRSVRQGGQTKGLNEKRGTLVEGSPDFAGCRVRPRRSTRSSGSRSRDRAPGRCRDGRQQPDSGNCGPRHCGTCQAKWQCSWRPA